MTVLNLELYRLSHDFRDQVHHQSGTRASLPGGIELITDDNIVHVMYAGEEAGTFPKPDNNTRLYIEAAHAILSNADTIHPNYTDDIHRMAWTFQRTAHLESASLTSLPGGIELVTEGDGIHIMNGDEEIGVVPNTQNESAFYYNVAAAIWKSPANTGYPHEVEAPS